MGGAHYVRARERYKVGRLYGFINPRAPLTTDSGGLDEEEIYLNPIPRCEVCLSYLHLFAYYTVYLLL